MSDRYSQLVNAPGRLGTIAKQLGLPQPVELDRYQPGAPVVAGPVLCGAAPGGRLGKADRRRSSTRSRPNGPAPRARPRRSSSTPPGSPTRPSWSSCSASSTPPSRRLRAQRPRRRARHAAGRGRLGPRAHTAQRALEGFTRSLGKEIGGARRDRAARLRRRRAPRTSSTRRCASCSRRARPTSPARSCGSARASRRPRDRLGAAARRQGRAGHRRLARDRRRDRRRPSPATAPRSSASTSRRRRTTCDAVTEGSAASAIELDITADDAPERIAEQLRRRRRRRRPQRRRHPRPDDREDARGALERS